MRPILNELGDASVEAVEGGVDNSTDEQACACASRASCACASSHVHFHHSRDDQTIPFQGAAAGLKQKCGKFKAAGDGLQNDARCKPGGFMSRFEFRLEMAL